MAAITSAVIGVAVAGISMQQSFAQKAAAQRDADEAMGKSEELMDEAKKLAEKSFADGLSVPLDAYDQETEANLAATTQVVESLQEGDARNLAAGVGRVASVNTEANENIRIAKAEKMYGLDLLKTEEQSAINQDMKDIAVGAAIDQNLIARDKREAEAAANQNIVAAGGQMLKSGASLVPLFSDNKVDKQLDKLLKAGGAINGSASVSGGISLSGSGTTNNGAVPDADNAANPNATSAISTNTVGAGGATNATTVQRDQWNNATQSQRDRVINAGVITYDVNGNIIWI